LSSLKKGIAITNVLSGLYYSPGSARGEFGR
jgi:hypothetical protein